MRAPKTQQILLVSIPYIEKSEQRAKLLLQHPLNPTRQIVALKKKASTKEPRSRRRSRKIQVTKNLTGQQVEPEEDKRVDNKVVKATETIQKVMSATETSSKIHKPKTYKEAMANSVHF